MQRKDEDEAWRAIVDNYGERPTVDLEPSADPDAPEDAEADDGHGDREYADDAGPAPEYPADPLDEQFVPPTPPPIPRPPIDRLAAWCGLVGAPAVLVLAALVGIVLADWVLLVLVAAFIGGFGYLVLTMGRHPRPPWDDGAEV